LICLFVFDITKYFDVYRILFVCCFVYLLFCLFVVCSYFVGLLFVRILFVCCFVCCFCLFVVYSFVYCFVAVVLFVCCFVCFVVLVRLLFVCSFIVVPVVVMGSGYLINRLATLARDRQTIYAI
jgi:hypothetical protein